MEKEQRVTLIHILSAAIMLVGLHFVPFGDIAGLSSRGNAILKFALYLIPYLTVGYEVLGSGLRNIFKGEFLDEEFLMMLATLGAITIGEYPEATAVMLFYTLGEFFSDIAEDKSRKSISDLMDICPQRAVVIREGEEIELAPADVNLGEIVLVRPGEKVPIDGVVVEGTSTLNTSALTGESTPADAFPGEKVFSGTINLNAALQVKTTARFEDSTVAKILELVENSSEKKSRSEKFITRFARWYTPAVVLGAFLIAVLCAIFSSLGIRGSIYRGLVFLVVSCPCALVVSVPLSFFGGIGAASRRGILVKGSNYLESLAKIDTLVLDKTGTITKGAFAVEAVHPLGNCQGEESHGEPTVSESVNLSEAMLLDIAALAESRSRHPVAESITEAHGGRFDTSRLGEVEELPGAGLRAVIDGVTYYVGNGKLMQDIGADFKPCHLSGTIVHLARATAANGQGKPCEYLGHIVINDEIKEDSTDALAEIKREGVARIVMLTGDNEQVAANVAQKVGLTEYFAGLLPADKVTKLEDMLNAAKTVAFAGDGINDAPVLTRADLGIAMGALGSDAAIEAADVVLMDDHLSRIPEAIRIARKTMRIVKQNIVLSIAVKFIILLLGALGLAGMRLAIFGDVGVLILAVLNAMRAYRTR